jgi:cytochrome c556
MKRSLLVVAGLTLGLTAAFAQSDPIAQRKNVMKGVGAATRTGTQMARGEIPFDAAKAKEILQTYARAAATTHEFFPETAKTGGETTASPRIWENQADFRARFDAWGRDIEKASASTNDLDSFKTAFAEVTKACGACHQTYRIQRN